MPSRHGKHRKARKGHTRSVPSQRKGNDAPSNPTPTPPSPSTTGATRGDDAKSPRASGSCLTMAPSMRPGIHETARGADERTLPCDGRGHDRHDAADKPRGGHGDTKASATKSAAASCRPVGGTPRIAGQAPPMGCPPGGAARQAPQAERIAGPHKRGASKSTIKREARRKRARQRRASGSPDDPTPSVPTHSGTPSGGESANTGVDADDRNDSGRAGSGARPGPRRTDGGKTAPHRAQTETAAEEEEEAEEAEAPRPRADQGRRRDDGGRDDNDDGSAKARAMRREKGDGKPQAPPDRAATEGAQTREASSLAGRRRRGRGGDSEPSAAEMGSTGRKGPTAVGAGVVDVNTRARRESGGNASASGSPFGAVPPRMSMSGSISGQGWASLVSPGGEAEGSIVHRRENPPGGVFEVGGPLTDVGNKYRQRFSAEETPLWSASPSGGSHCMRMEDAAIARCPLVDFDGERPGNAGCGLFVVADGHGSVPAFTLGRAKHACRWIGGYECAALSVGAVTKYITRLAASVDLQRLTSNDVAKVMKDAFAYAQMVCEEETAIGAWDLCGADATGKGIAHKFEAVWRRGNRVEVVGPWDTDREGSDSCHGAHAPSHPNVDIPSRNRHGEAMAVATEGSRVGGLASAQPTRYMGVGRSGGGSGSSDAKNRRMSAIDGPHFAALERALEAQRSIARRPEKLGGRRHRHASFTSMGRNRGPGSDSHVSKDNASPTSRCNPESDSRKRSSRGGREGGGRTAGGDDPTGAGRDPPRQQRTEGHRGRTNGSGRRDGDTRTCKPGVEARRYARKLDAVVRTCDDHRWLVADKVRIPYNGGASVWYTDADGDLAWAAEYGCTLTALLLVPAERRAASAPDRVGEGQSRVGRRGAPTASGAASATSASIPTEASVPRSSSATSIRASVTSVQSGASSSSSSSSSSASSWPSIPSASSGSHTVSPQPSLPSRSSKRAQRTPSNTSTPSGSMRSSGSIDSSDRSTDKYRGVPSLVASIGDGVRWGNDGGASQRPSQSDGTRGGSVTKERKRRSKDEGGEDGKDGKAGKGERRGEEGKQRRERTSGGRRASVRSSVASLHDNPTRSSLTSMRVKQAASAVDISHRAEPSSASGQSRFASLSGRGRSRAATAYVAHVGDTDAYVFRRRMRDDGRMGYVHRRLVGNHTCSNPREVERVAAMGMACRPPYFCLDEGPAAGHMLMPSRSIAHTVMSKHGIAEGPSVFEAPLWPGDVVIVATDGLWTGYAKGKGAFPKGEARGGRATEGGEAGRVPETGGTVSPPPTPSLNHAGGCEGLELEEASARQVSQLLTDLLSDSTTGDLDAAGIARALMDDLVDSLDKRDNVALIVVGVRSDAVLSVARRNRRGAARGVRGDRGGPGERRR